MKALMGMIPGRGDKPEVRSLRDCSLLATAACTMDVLRASGI